MIATLMMPAKFGYDVIINVVMWPKFGNCSILMGEVIIPSIL